MDEINLTPKEVLECIQLTLDNKVLRVELSGRELRKYEMKKNFVIIATQNPNKGALTNKRQELWVGFLSLFQKINFPNFTKEELMEIAKGLAKQNNYNGKGIILNDIVSFHINWEKGNNSINDVQCFIIREIESVIRAITQKKYIYDKIMTIYGARYQKKIKKKLNEYKTLKNEKLSDLKLPEEFPHWYKNDNLSETVSSVLFSLKNERYVIIEGEDENDITQVAR